MKNIILLGSAGSAVIATAIGILSVYSQGAGVSLGDTVETSLRLYQIAGMFGLLSIATFFVGWVFPSTVTETQVLSKNGTRTVRRGA